MDARELRIGNAIWFDRREKVKWVNSRVIADIESQNNECLYSPITLTEEWLDSFGFETDGVTFKIKVNGLRVVLFQINKSNNYNDNVNEFTVTVYQHKEAIEISRIKYVHQLQNLYFALTGKELTIKETVL